jgi:hypothetical protein
MAGAAQSRAARQPARCAPGPEFPSVTSQFPTYFAVKIVSASDGYALIGELAWHCCLFFGSFPWAFSTTPQFATSAGRSTSCKELNDAGQPDVVQEVMIKRIIAAARRGERDVKRLRDAGLTGVRKPNHQTVGGGYSPNAIGWSAWQAQERGLPNALPLSTLLLIGISLASAE